MASSVGIDFAQRLSLIVGLQYRFNAVQVQNSASKEAHEDLERNVMSGLWRLSFWR